MKSTDEMLSRSVIHNIKVPLSILHKVTLLLHLQMNQEQGTTNTINPNTAMPVKSKEEYERTIRNTLGSAKQAMTLFRNMIQVQFKEYYENYGASDMALTS